MSVDLQREAEDPLQKVTSISLRKNTRLIATNVSQIDFATAPEEARLFSEKLACKASKQLQLERYLEGINAIEPEKVELLDSNTIKQENSNDSGDSDDDTDLLPNLEKALAFIKSSRATVKLREQVLCMVWEEFDMIWARETLTSTPDLLKLAKPYEVTILKKDPRYLSDSIKDTVERLTGKPWIWTPFQPPKPILEPQKLRINWEVWP